MFLCGGELHSRQIYGRASSIHRDMPVIPFVKGRKMPTIPQSEKDLSFCWSKITKGLDERVIEEITEDYAMKCIAEGKTMSAAFMACSGQDTEQKGRFVQNLH